MKTLLRYVLHRLHSLDAPILSLRETAQFPKREVKALEKSGVLGKAPDADEILHPRFPMSGRMVTVQRTALGKVGVASEEDEYFDPIPLGDDDDRQYSVSIPKLVEVLRKENGICGDGDAVGAGMIPVGQKSLDGHGVIDVYLSLPNTDVGAVTTRCLSLVKPTGVKKLAVLLPSPLRFPAHERQLLDARGIVLISLSSTADGGSLAVEWEPHVIGVSENRPDGVYPPRTVIVAGREYKCDLKPDEMTFLEIAVRSDEVELGRLIHRGQDALWRETFSEAFDEALRQRRVKIIKTQFRAPNMNAFVERFVQSIQQECLDHFIVFGAQHLDYLCREYVEYYLTERPHQGIGIDNELLVKEGPRRRRRTSDPDDLPRLADVRRHSRLGGLLNSYYRRAA